MRKSFKYDKLLWLMMNKHVLELIPLKYEIRKSIIKREEFATVLKAMQDAKLYSKLVDIDDVEMSIIKLANEARTKLRRIHEDNCSERQARLGKDNTVRFPCSFAFKMRADAICQGPL